MSRVEMTILALTQFIDSGALLALMVLSCLYLLFGLDDAFIDAMAFWRQQKPKLLTHDELGQLKLKPERALAVIVPAWKESGIIYRMLIGNLRRLCYSNCTFFVGVYPNDPDTLAEVQRASVLYPNIVAVVNDRPGPTSKGQILNQVVDAIAGHEARTGRAFDALVMQDAEDVIHPMAFALMNHALDDAAFVQIPVFSLKVGLGDLVAGTYIDEFAELHTKDILVRGYLGAAIPSAGVGTALSRALVNALVAQGGVFRENTLTEDYDLGVRAKTLGFRSVFACCRYHDERTGEREFIATREYFPKRFTRSVRQKTRWTIGIVLQGWRNLGWVGGWADQYFLYRDRRGVVANLASMTGYGVLAYVCLRSLFVTAPVANLWEKSPLLPTLLTINLGLMLNRFLQRSFCVLRIYGLMAALAVALRWPLGIVINALACLNALKQDLMARWTKKAVAWCKTDHELPSTFDDAEGDKGVVTVATTSSSQTLIAWWLFFAMGCLVPKIAVGKCVQLFYDRVPNAKPAYHYGRQHTMMLQNLLGHFPKVQQYVIPIEMYKKGDLERCEANIYLGSHFDDNIPEAFYADFMTTKKHVAWAGYKIWQLGDDNLEKLWGVKYRALSTLDSDHRDAAGKPTFYQLYDYKGETFRKYAEWDKTEKARFNAAFEITLFDFVTPGSDRHVLSWARHTGTDERTPYILRHANRWYIGDTPFSYTTEEDRYLIFADLLFDILDEAPRYAAGKRPAVLRFEDVHPNVELWQLYVMSNMAIRLNVPIVMTIIPIFSDPLGVTTIDPMLQFVPMTANQGFLDYISYVKGYNARFIFHGVTHQLGMQKNPFSGMTGDDFEFWDRVNNSPIPQDSPDYVVNRLEDGLKILDRAGIRPFAWLSPHYQSSPLDYVIFGQLFRWNMGRLIYFPYSKKQAQRLPETLGMDVAGVKGEGQRMAYFKDLQVDFPRELAPTGQFFPYEIYGDYYGTRILPENIGNIQPYMNEQVLKTETVDDMIRHIRLSRVIRDAWASFFVHPFRLEDTSGEGVGLYPGDTSHVEELIAETRKAGFEFIDLQNFAEQNLEPVRPEPIEYTIPESP